MIPNANFLKYFGDVELPELQRENNAAQYYPDYAYNHPPFQERMHRYSDSKISDFLAGIEDDQRIGTYSSAKFE